MSLKIFFATVVSLILFSQTSFAADGRFKIERDCKDTDSEVIHQYAENALADGADTNDLEAAKLIKDAIHDESNGSRYECYVIEDKNDKSTTDITYLLFVDGQEYTAKIYSSDLYDVFPKIEIHKH